MRKYLITGDWSQSIKGLRSSHGIGIWQLCLGFPRCGGSSRRNRKFPGVSLTLCCFVVYSTRRFVSSLVLFYFVLVFFSPFSIAITARGEKRADLSAFSYACSICACLVFSVSSSSSCLERAAAWMANYCFETESMTGKLENTGILENTKMGVSQEKEER